MLFLLCIFRYMAAMCQEFLPFFDRGTKSRTASGDALLQVRIQQQFPVLFVEERFSHAVQKRPEVADPLAELAWQAA